MNFSTVGVNSGHLLKSISKAQSGNIYDLSDLGFTTTLPNKIGPTFNNPFDLELTNLNNTPEYLIPKSFYLRKPILKSSHIAKFSEFTLFYIFFSMASELHQALAAENLYRKNWKFDATQQTWAREMAGKWEKFDCSSWKIVPCTGSGW